MLSPQSLCYADVVGVGMGQDNRTHLAGTRADLAQRVNHHRIVLGPGGIDDA
jgi:hypothetical protein